MNDKIKCPYCGKEAKWCENKVVYGKNYGKSYMCYYCADCDAYVGCHNNTTEPLGTMANKELRELRVKCHELFDRFWQDKKMTRKEAYKLLEEKTGIKHIAWTTKEECEKIVSFLTPNHK
jgi:hypothetical protein